MPEEWSPFEETEWLLAHDLSIALGPMSTLMGILNVTPDSFSDGGNFVGRGAALAQAMKMSEEGADIIDIGGESTRPGAEEVDQETEQARVLPVVHMLANEIEPLLSIDTWRSKTAAAAIDAGAHIINDVWGCQKDPDIAKVAAETGAGLVIMHTGREREVLPDVIDDQIGFFQKSLEIAENAGVDPGQIVLDPGFGFAKNTQTNLELLYRLDELHVLGFPLLVGTSRKRFLGEISGRDAANRDVLTAGSSMIARQQGASIFRVHNVAASADTLIFCDLPMMAEEVHG